MEWTHLCNLVDGITGNYRVKLFKFGPVVQMSFKDFLFLALAAFLFGGAEPFMQFR